MSERTHELLVAELLAPASAPEARTRDVMFYSGAKVARYDFWKDEEYLLSFSMDPRDYRLDRLNAGAPVFKDHWALLDNTVGVTSNARVEGKKAFATMRFSERPEVDGLWQDIQDGILNSVSMGVMIDEMEETQAANPKKGQLREMLARGWEPFEISVVPIGADPKARFLAAQLMSAHHFVNRARPMSTGDDESEIEVPAIAQPSAAALARYQLALARNTHTARAHTERRMR